MNGCALSAIIYISILPISIYIWLFFNLKKFESFELVFKHNHCIIFKLQINDLQKHAGNINSLWPLSLSHTHQKGKGEPRKIRKKTQRCEMIIQYLN